MTEQELLRMRYLVRLYEPELKYCRECNYSCDFRIDESDLCPCEWVQEYGKLFSNKKPSEGK